MTDGQLRDIQLLLRPGIVEFGWGHPDPALLPVADLRRAADTALARAGAAALAYGAEQGPWCLIDALCHHLHAVDGARPDPAHILITGGVSQALDLLCTLLTQPGDIALVESPVYHLALRILRDHGLQLLPVATDEHGLRIDALEEALAQVQRSGRRAPLLYTVPTFSNPTGRTLAPLRRRALMRLAEQHNLLVLEDDVYRELWYDAPPPPPLAGYGSPANVARLGSFAKVLAPGLRLGWVHTDVALVQRCVRSGLLDSGGGVNHFTAQIVAAYMQQDRLAGHVEGLRAAYRARRDTLITALERYMPGACRFSAPGGGFFVWVALPEGVDSAVLLPHAEAAGVSYLPGAQFHSDGGGQQWLRLAFSLLPLAEMEEGVRRLARVVQTASAQAL